MTINFKQIITNSGEKISQRQLAREMVAKGIFKTLNSAVTMMQYNASGRNKSIDKELLKFMMKRFNLSSDQVLGGK